MKNLKIHSFFVLALCSALGVVQLSAQDAAHIRWEQVPLASPYDQGHYLSVRFLESNSNYGWVSGHNGYVLRTTDGGATWRGSQTPVPAQLEDIVFVNERVGFAAGIGKAENMQQTGGVFKSIDGGETWTDVTPKIISGNSVIRMQMFGCHFSDENNGIAVGGGCGEPQYFLRTTNGGANWTLFMTQLPMSGVSHAVMGSSNGECFASSSGFIWRSGDGGATWNLFSQTGEQFWQEGFSRMGNSFLVATSGTNCNGGNEQRGDVRFSSDMGKSWRTAVATAQMFGSFLVNEHEGWAVGSNAALFHTNDAGVTWTAHTDGIAPNANLDAVWFTPVGRGFVAGQGGLYRTAGSSTLTADYQANTERYQLRIAPMPITKSADISFTLPASSMTGVYITDLMGHRIATVHDGVLQEGAQHFSFDATTIANGEYIVVLSTPQSIISEKILVVK